MAALLAPGGRFYLAEFHPITDVFGDDDLTVVHPYFNGEPLEWDESGTYADLTAADDSTTARIEWQHGLGDVVSALIAAGLRIELLHEHDHTLFPRWPFLVRDGAVWRLPEGTPSLPLMFSLRAVPADEARGVLGQRRGAGLRAGRLPAAARRAGSRAARRRARPPPATAGAARRRRASRSSSPPTARAR